MNSKKITVKYFILVDLCMCGSYCAHILSRKMCLSVVSVYVLGKERERARKKEGECIYVKKD